MSEPVLEMTNPLTSLDELIWKQFEKVTQYAHKEYGWDKYDLANVMHLSGSMAMAGMCTYASILEAINHQYGTSAVVGSLIVPIAYHHQSQRSFYEQLKKIELKTLTITSTAVQYSFDSLRSSLLIGSLVLTVLGINHVAQADDTKQILEGLVLIGGAVGFASSQAAHYFITQLPTHPSTKKPFWKTTYERIRNKLKPKPQLEPAAEPAQQYVTIDTLVA